MTKKSAVELVVVPCLRDNYAFLVHNKESGETALIDAPEAAPIQAVLDARGWTLNDILITHHHNDHIDGVAALRGAARVIGAKADAHRLPDLDLAVSEGDAITVCGQPTKILDVSGHTIGHIAYHMAEAGFAFTADSLMALGCGRLFEGTPAQMWDSMQKLRELPDDTLICSGHEYTETNARFAASLDPDNPDLISRIKRIETARATLLPQVQYAYTEDRQEAYLDSLSNPVPAQIVSLGELSTSLGWEMPIGDTGLTDFTGELSGIWGVQDGGGSVFDGGRGRLDLGLSHDTGTGLRIGLGSYLDGIGNAELTRRGIEVTVDWQF